MKARRSRVTKKVATGRRQKSRLQAMKAGEL
jgi:hypothetical protein